MGLRDEKKDSGVKAEKSNNKESKSTKVEAKSFDVETKVAKIKASKMPEAQKEQYIRNLQIGDADEGTKISFAVYCQRKKVKPHLRVPMQAYPSAKGVESAPFGVWEEIYKNF